MQNGYSPLEMGTNDDVVEIPSNNIMSPREDIITYIFGEKINSDYKSQLKLATCAILAPTNHSVQEINLRVLERMEGQLHISYSFDTIKSDDSDDRERFTVEHLNSLLTAGIPPHELKLKIGCICILLRNLDVDKGLCNGTRLLIEKISSNVLLTRIISGDKANTTVFIPKIDIFTSDVDFPFILRRCQFPIKLAFAMTVNKSQGQTFDKIGLYLRSNIFAHGQLYVALSRVRKFSAFKIQIFPPNEDEFDFNSPVLVKNVVYQEIFND